MITVCAVQCAHLQCGFRAAAENALHASDAKAINDVLRQTKRHHLWYLRAYHIVLHMQ